MFRFRRIQLLLVLVSISLFGFVLIIGLGRMFGGDVFRNDLTFPAYWYVLEGLLMVSLVILVVSLIKDLHQLEYHQVEYSSSSVDGLLKSVRFLMTILIVVLAFQAFLAGLALFVGVLGHHDSASGLLVMQCLEIAAVVAWFTIGFL